MKGAAEVLRAAAWRWWAGSYADVEYEGTYTLGDFATREEVIAAARAAGLGSDGEPERLFYIIEAQEGEYKLGDDVTPFAAMRNGELLSLDATHSAAGEPA